MKLLLDILVQQDAEPLTAEQEREIFLHLDEAKREIMEYIKGYYNSVDLDYYDCNIVMPCGNIYLIKDSSMHTDVVDRINLPFISCELGLWRYLVEHPNNPLFWLLEAFEGYTHLIKNLMAFPNPPEDIFHIERVRDNVAEQVFHDDFEPFIVDTAVGFGGDLFMPKDSNGCDEFDDPDDYEKFDESEIEFDDADDYVASDNALFESDEFTDFDESSDMLLHGEEVSHPEELYREEAIYFDNKIGTDDMLSAQQLKDFGIYDVLNLHEFCAIYQDFSKYI